MKMKKAGMIFLFPKKMGWPPRLLRRSMSSPLHAISTILEFFSLLLFYFFHSPEGRAPTCVIGSDGSSPLNNKYTFSCEMLKKCDYSEIINGAGAEPALILGSADPGIF
jgi:hypothetical protein